MLGAAGRHQDHRGVGRREATDLLLGTQLGCAVSLAGDEGIDYAQCYEQTMVIEPKSLPLLSFSITVTMSLRDVYERLTNRRYTKTHISSPSRSTVPIPHSSAYRLSSLRSLARTYRLPLRPVSLITRAGSPCVIVIVQRSRWKTGRDVSIGRGSGRMDFRRRGLCVP